MRLILIWFRNLKRHLNKNETLSNQVQLQRRIIHKLQENVENVSLDLDKEKLKSKSLSKGRKNKSLTNMSSDNIKTPKGSNNSSRKKNQFKSDKKVRKCYQSVRMGKSDNS